jgi:hypothetical protein
MNNIDDMINDILCKMGQVQFPQNAQADWQGTNHFEIHNLDGDENAYWWLDCWDALEAGGTWRANPQSERLGVVLDAACMVRALIDEIYRLRKGISALGSEEAS